MGAGEGTDYLDFLADLSALKVIDPDSISKAPASGEVPMPNSPSILLEQPVQERVPYSHCAWCRETPKTRSMPEEQHYDIHHVVLQPSCCAPPSVFQTIMGMGIADTSLVAPELCLLDETESDVNEYMLEPTDPVVCLPDQHDPDYWHLRRSADECKYGGPGSTMNFWAQSSFIDRLTLGVKMRWAILKKPSSTMQSRWSVGFKSAVMACRAYSFPIRDR